MTAPRPQRDRFSLPLFHGPNAVVYYRDLEIRAAYDQRSEKPSEDYGISGIRMNFSMVASDRKSGIHWELLTDMFLPETNDRLDAAGQRRSRVTPGPVSFHTSDPQYEQHERQEDCNLLLDGICHYDLSFLMGDEAYAAFAHGSVEGLSWWMAERLNDYLEIEDE